jgi:UDP-glucose 4-epimerase
MNIIITGGCGFIGSHIVEHLLAKKHKVWIIDDLSSGNISNVSKHYDVTLYRHNCQSCKMEQFPDRVDALIHLAAWPSVEVSWNSILGAHENTLTSTLHVVEMARSLNIHRIVFASSSAVYGDTPPPLLESNIPKPLSPYGLQKLTSENYLTLFAPAYGYSVVNLRLFNVYGPRQLASSEYAGVVARFTDARLQDRPLYIYGDGQQSRDFIAVRDVAAAFVSATEMDMMSGETLTCNVGTGKSISIEQLARSVNKLIPEKPVDVLFKPRRAGDIPSSQADITLAKARLNFKPKLRIEDGLMEYWQWLEQEKTLLSVN